MKQVSGRSPPSLSRTACLIFTNKMPSEFMSVLKFFATAIQNIITNLLPSLYFMPIQPFFNPDTGQ